MLFYTSHVLYLIASEQPLFSALITCFLFPAIILRLINPIQIHYLNLLPLNKAPTKAYNCIIFTLSLGDWNDNYDFGRWLVLVVNQHDSII